MKKVVTTAVISTIALITLSSSSAFAAGGTASKNDTFWENEWWVSQNGGSVYSPFALFVSALTDYYYPGDATVKITKMDNYIAWKNYKGYQYGGSVKVGVVNWYTSSNSPAGSYSLPNNGSYFSTPDDLFTGKYWSGTMWQLKGNYEVATYSWTCSGGCTPLVHNETLDLWF